MILSRLSALVVGVVAPLLAGGCAISVSDDRALRSDESGLDPTTKTEASFHTDDYGVPYVYGGPCNDPSGFDPWGAKSPWLPGQHRCAHAERVAGYFSQVSEMSRRAGPGLLRCEHGRVVFSYCPYRDICGLTREYTYDCMPEIDDTGGYACRDANHYYGTCVDTQGVPGGDVLVWCEGARSGPEFASTDVRSFDCSAWTVRDDDGERPARCGDLGSNESGWHRGVNCF